MDVTLSNHQFHNFVCRVCGARVGAGALRSKRLSFKAECRLCFQISRMNSYSAGEIKPLPESVPVLNKF